MKLIERLDQDQLTTQNTRQLYQVVYTAKILHDQIFLEEWAAKVAADVQKTQMQIRPVDFDSSLT